MIEEQNQNNSYQKLSTSDVEQGYTQNLLSGNDTINYTNSQSNTIENQFEEENSQNKFCCNNIFQKKYLIILICALISLFVIGLIIYFVVSAHSKEMNIRYKVGQSLILSLSGTSLLPLEKKLISEYKVGNFIFMGRNILDPQQIFNFTHEIKELCKKSGLPIPFLSIDLEGGDIVRIKNKFFPAPMGIHATEHPEYTNQVSHAISFELKRLGLNLNFSPVSDINFEPMNPIIGSRSYGDDVSSVSEYVTRFIVASHENKILTSTKHFPGHGDVSQDSHETLPFLNRTDEELKERELIPFKAAIEAGTDTILVSHITTPSIFPLPSSLSQHMIDIIRNDLHFDGLLITDDLEMGAIQKNYTFQEAITIALSLGEIVLSSADLQDKYLNILENIYKDVKSGKIPMKVLDDIVEKAIKLKNNLPQIESQLEPTDTNLDSEVENVFDSSITVYRDDIHFIPAKKDEFITIGPSYGTAFVGGLKNYFESHYGIPMLDTNTVSYNEIMSKAKSYPKVVFLAWKLKSHPDLCNLIRDIEKVNSNICVVSLYDPYDVMYLDNIRSIVVGYAHVPDALDSVMKVLLGDIEAHGKYPVHLP